LDFLYREKLQSLINLLIDSGYHCIGPQVRNNAIVFDTLTSTDQLPQGILDDQAPGAYTLTRTNSPKYFQWTTGPQALKPLVFTPYEKLWSSTKNSNGGLSFNPIIPEDNKLAIIGVRACDIAALYLMDKHFLHDHSKDAHYLARRQNMFLVVMNCTRSAQTCFCVSTDDGPRAHYGYDIVMTELDDGYTIDSLSEHGKNILQQLDTQPANEEQKSAEVEAIQNAINLQKRNLPSHNLKKILFENLQHPHWDDIAQRCLSCGNCTAVCPTCFCHAEFDTPDLGGKENLHIRQWDSCFTSEHSYIHGITIRSQTSQRYRQWLTHKLGSWHDQFGRSGCVGCGRCISWCPVEIDLTEEIKIIAGETD
jgi:ferredoxin